MFEGAYSGTVFTSYEDNLLANSINLIDANVAYLAHIDGVNPAIYQIIYHNVSNIYDDLYVDWLNYAYDNSLDPEDAFYHAAVA